MHYEYCPQCGAKLEDKIIGDEGFLPYCENCQQPYWDSYGSSVICAVINENNEIALLRQNYVSTTNYVLVAGMIKIGETSESTAKREITEELGLDTCSLHFIKSYFYEKKSLLMHGFLVRTHKKNFNLSTEVDNACWVPITDSPSLLREGGIAWQLVKEIIDQKLYTAETTVRSTAKAIIRHNSKILLNKCFDKYNGHYYSLPGGGQKKYETIYEAVKRESLEETGYFVGNLKFLGLCEEICDNEDTRSNYSQYAHKLYHIFQCELESEKRLEPTEIDDMQESSHWIEIKELENIRILPDVLGKNIIKLLNSQTPMDMGSIHIPYNHG